MTGGMPDTAQRTFHHAISQHNARRARHCALRLHDIGRLLRPFLHPEFGPPLSDTESGSSTVYNWRGGYKKATIPARFEEGKDGKKGRQISPARTASLSCTVQLVVSSNYTITSVRTVSDRPGVNGPSYCAEFLAAN